MLFLPFFFVPLWRQIDDVMKIGDKEILGVLITHNHFDHVGALSYFEDYNIYSSSNLEEKEYNIGPFKFDVIFTPGHSSDSTSYYFKDDNLYKEKYSIAIEKLYELLQENKSSRNAS